MAFQPDPYQIDAKKLLERISGTKVSPDHPLVQQMASLIKAKDLLGAARLATTHPGFLNITVKQMALKMSTREETINIKLNDFAASFIGVTRDGKDARELLTGNFYYSADPTNVVTEIINSNSHFSKLDRPDVDLGQVLKRVEGQPLLDGSGALVTNPDAAGVLSSRTFMGAHLDAGTNRRPVEFTFREFMCLPIEKWADASRSDIRIGRDVDRFPGGDNAKFQTSCKSCHSGLDAFRGAFARWDFNGSQLMNTQTSATSNAFDQKGIALKLNKNSSTFTGGYVTFDNSFINNSQSPANTALLGWRNAASSGQGVHDFGVMIANSKRFSQCIVKRVYEAVCRAPLDFTTQSNFIKDNANLFEKNNYDIQRLFQDLAVTPLCGGK
jgi:hypothetical protein